MKQFLNVVAKGYKDKYKDVSRLNFIMPNKRSCSFLMKQFNSLSISPSISPNVITISEFIENCCDKVQDSRIDQLFRLYTAYKALPGSNPEMTFEKFCSWGETIMTDFNEIDVQMADAEEIYKNVTDLSQIKSNFLTDEQKAIMVEYFGYSPAVIEEGAKQFWQTFNTENNLKGKKGKEGIRDKFLSLWQLMYPLYRKYHESLAQDGLTTMGGAYREVAQKIEKGFEPFPGEKIIFVGFNALSHSERAIFSELRDMRVKIGDEEEPKADFIWDRVADRLAEGDDPAVRFINFNTRSTNYPLPDWIEMDLERSVPDTQPEIEVISVPSNVMQVKVASEELSKIAARVSAESIQDAQVAVILPDENLLLPLLYSLPEEYPNPNLTMGFPLKQTPVISFASLLRKLHSRSRKTSEGAEFFFEDVKDFLAHPYSHILFSAKERGDFIRINETRKRIMVSTEMLSELGPNSEKVYRYISEDDKPLKVVDYIGEVLHLVNEKMGKKNGTYLRADIEKTYIDTYGDALRRLAQCLETYPVALSASGVFMLADRLIAGETVAFEGEPLEGLQVMGVLETRCLDFDKIVMLSVNEKIMPRVGRNTSFIPNVIRGAYGMPPANYQEELFAYYFFRLLSRCSQAVLTFDSRSNDTRSGGPSRYLLQLKYLLGIVKEREKAFAIPSSARKPMSIPKEGEILEMLNRYGENRLAFLGVKPKNFSATALGHYFECQVKFLFNDVLEMYVEPEKTETINAMDLGTIVHGIIEALYIRDKNERNQLLAKPKIMTAERLRAMLKEQTPDGKNLIEELARREILTTHFGIEEEKIRDEEVWGSASIITDTILRFVRNIIEADILQAPFRLWGCEIKETVNYELPGGETVRLKLVIDRLDQQGAEDPDAPFRIVDYKTGKVHLKADSLEDVFDWNYKSKNIFQLMLYAETLILMVERGEITLPEGVDKEKFISRLQMAIYAVPLLPDITKGVLPPNIGREIKDIEGLRQAEIEWPRIFRETFDEKISEILDEEIPFAAEPGEDLCRYCDFKLQCESYADASDTEQQDE